MLKVSVNKKAFDLSISRITSSLEQRNNLLETIGIRLVAYTRETINLQGRGRPWAPLASSTKRSTGREKALTPLIPLIKHRVNSRAGVSVYFAGRPTDWSIDMHEKGFTSPAVKGKFMKAPRLGKFFSRKASKIPARKIFPTKAEASSIAGMIVKDWVQEIARKSWK